MMMVDKTRKQQIKSALLPLCNERKLRQQRLIKSNSLIQQINLDEIMEEAESRLNFTHSPTTRQNQQLSFIKSKFIRMIELQNKSFIERNELQKQREAILKEQDNRVKSKAKRVKDQMSRKGETTRNWRVRNMHEGAIVRETKIYNDLIRARRDNDELKAKKDYVNDRHRSMLVTQGKAIESKISQSLNKRLKWQYRCGLFHKMSQYKLSPRESLKMELQPNLSDTFRQTDCYKWQHFNHERQ